MLDINTKSRIVLIMPNVTMKKSNIPPHANYPPLGLCYIAGVLEKEKYPVFIIDARTLNLNEIQIKEKIEVINPSIVGFTAYLFNHKSMIQSIDLIKKINKEIKVVVGGPNASSLKEKMFSESENIDYIIYGEGEYTMFELIQAIEKKISLNKIKGLIYKEEEKIRDNGPREWISNLDELPLPARHLLPEIANKEIYFNYFRHKRLPITSIITSRGCPYNCIFCDRVLGKKFRAHSSKRVIEEIKYLILNYRIKEIHIFDDTFIVDVNRVKEICNQLITEKIDITWSCNGRIDILSKHKEIIPLMKKAGCWYISFGIESGNQNVLNFLKKCITIEQIKEVIKLVHKNKIMTGGYFIIGSPIDTKETIEETINLAKSLPLDTAQFGLMIPYPGTEIYDIAQKKGRLNKIDYEEMTPRSKHPAYIAEGLSEEYLIKVQEKAYKEFTLRPKYLIKQIKNISNITILKNYLRVGKKYIKLLISK